MLWESLLVSAAEFAALEEEIAARPHRFHINWLSHETLDRLYVMIFPDGSLVVPVGGSFRSYGPFLDVADLDEALARADFDAAKNLRHSRGWEKSGDAPAI